MPSHASNKHTAASTKTNRRGGTEADHNTVPLGPTRTSAAAAATAKSKLLPSAADRTAAVPPTALDSPRRKAPAWNSSTSLISKRGGKPPNRPVTTQAATPGLTTKLPSGRASAVHSPISTAATSATSSKSSANLAQKYESVLGARSATDGELRDTLRTLRKIVLSEGLPPDPFPAPHRGPFDCSLRGRIWKVLLGIYRVSSTEYLSLIERGPCSVYEKIKNDTFRTLATDKKFLATVDENMLSRVLNAFVWKMDDAPPSRLLNLTYSYVQGMNVMAAPFLYVMPELDAFYTFTAFVQHSCPLYVQPALEGVHCGLKLLDKCLQVCDPILFRHLKSKQLTATVYAFPSVMTFSACTPPLDALLCLWDFLLCYGLHLNILCIISQLLLIRADLLKSTSPMKLLRTFPELDARQVIHQTLALIPRLPEDLYDVLVRHPFDAGVYDVIMGEDGEAETMMGGVTMAEAYARE